MKYILEYNNWRRYQRGKVNAPTLAYKTVYNKEPDIPLRAMTNQPKKVWNGMPVDKGLKDKWLKELNNLPVEIRSTKEGKSKERPAFVIFRLPIEYKNKTELFVKTFKVKNTFISFDIGMEGRKRICIASPITNEDPNWEKWWDNLPKEILKVYNKVIK